MQFNPETFDEEPNPEYALVRNDVKNYLNEFKAINELQAEGKDEIRARAQNKFAGYKKEANETGGFAMLSTWIKQYIAMTGRVRTIDGIQQFHTLSIPTLDLATGGPATDPNTGTPLYTELQLPIVDIVDPNRVYYGLTRAIGNTASMETRLEKLLLYTSFAGTEATSAFADQLLRDLAPIQYIRTSMYQHVLGDYGITGEPNSPAKLTVALQELNPNLTPEEALTVTQEAFTSYRETEPILIRELLEKALQQGTLDTYLNSEGKQILVKVIKGSDLWSRTMINMRIDPTTGLSVASNANQNRASKDLYLKWSAAYRPNTPASSIPGYTQPQGSVQMPLRYRVEIGLQLETLAAFRALPEDEQVWRLNRSLIQQSKEIRDQFARIGVTLADAYVQFNLAQVAITREPALAGVIKQTPAGRLLDLFQLPPDSDLTQKDVSLVGKYAAQGKHSPFTKHSDDEAKKIGVLGA